MACPSYSDTWLSQLRELGVNDADVLVLLEASQVEIHGNMGQSDVRATYCQTRYGHYRSLSKSSGDCRLRQSA